MSKVGGKIIALLCMLITVGGYAQVVTKGKIVFERRTNLLKQFDDERMRKMIDEKNKIKIDNFVLYFNDSVSNFSYQVPEVADPMSWMTMKNSVYVNTAKKQRVVYYDFWGTALTLTDSTVKREWKITDKTRKIAGYECTRAIWQKDDSTRIYAWFTTDIAPTVGPEIVGGLPGAVLGLATEDGGIVYFATLVDKNPPTAEQLAQPKSKGKDYNAKDLYDELYDKMKGEPMADRVLSALFYWEPLPK